MDDWKFLPPEKPPYERPGTMWAVKLVGGVLLALLLCGIGLRAAGAAQPQNWHEAIAQDIHASLQTTSETAGNWGVSTVTATELRRAYDTNEVRAVHMYGEKLAITGSISNIRLTAAGVPVITMYAGNPLKHVTLYIRRTGGADKWVAQQNKNDRVQVVCVKSSLVLGSVVANECEDARIFSSKAAGDYLRMLPALARKGDPIAVELMKQGARL